VVEVRRRSSAAAGGAHYKDKGLGAGACHKMAGHRQLMEEAFHRKGKKPQLDQMGLNRLKGSHYMARVYRIKGRQLYLAED
jgi:hypothetical protein